MSHLSRKLVAVLMLLWLPLSGGSALAASLSMQLQHAGCHEAAPSPAMSHMHMGEHHQHHGAMPASTDEQSAACSACGICHLACTGYLGVPSAEPASIQTAVREATPYVVAFDSHTSAPLVPPPLARA